ncbi:MAG: dihydroneopterin triphosphate diphosphatase [Rhizobacter sp.]
MADDSNALRRAYKIPESVLVVIHTADLQVLLLERADRAGFWQSVTGSRNVADEPLSLTAAREVAEETGILVGSARVPQDKLRDWNQHIEYEIYPNWRQRYAPGVTRNVEHHFSLEVPSDIDIVLSPREHLRHRWLPLAEAASACFSSSNAAAILQLPAHL